MISVYRKYSLLILILATGPQAKIFGQVDVVPSVSFLNFISDAIVVGRGSINVLDSNSSLLKIDVHRVVKHGKVSVPNIITIPILTDDTSCQAVRDVTPATEIFFLKETPDGQLALSVSPNSQRCNPLADGYDVPDGPISARWAYTDQLPASDRLAYELAATVEAHNGVGPYAFVLNANILSGVSDTGAKYIYNTMSGSPISSLRMLGTLGLVRIGDPGTLQALVNKPEAYLNVAIPSQIYVGQSLLTTASQQPTATFEGQFIQAVAAITNQNTETIAQLSNLLAQNTYTGLRLAAAKALRNMHTPKATFVLGPYLWDKSEDVRDEALAGVACFANGVPSIDNEKHPTPLDLNQPGSFKTNATLMHFAVGTQTIRPRESFYLEFWRQWWTSNGTKVESAQ